MTNRSTPTSEMLQAEFVSPGEGAYTVSLRSNKTDRVEKFTMIGADDRWIKLLPEGQYVVEIQQHSDRQSSKNYDVINISQDQRKILLSRYFARSEAIKKASINKPNGFEPLTIHHQKLEKRHPRSSGELENSSQFARNFAQEGQSEAWSSAITEQQRFAIGVSQHDANEKPGWNAAKTLGWELVSESEKSIRLHFFEIASSKLQQHNRFRLTLSAFGTPAIRVPLPLFAGGISVNFKITPLGNKSNLQIELGANDPRIETMVSALDRLEKHTAISIVNWASASHYTNPIAWFMDQRKDNWSATTAGLLLARSNKLLGLEKWAVALAESSPHISDANVIAAWASALSDSWDLKTAEMKALHYLIRARHIGAPAFGLTQTLALELLNGLRSGSSSPEMRERARNEIDLWTNRSSRRVFESPYFIWQQAGKMLQKGELPAKGYTTLVRGIMSRSGMRITERTGENNLSNEKNASSSGGKDLSHNQIAKLRLDALEVIEDVQHVFDKIDYFIRLNLEKDCYRIKGRVKKNESIVGKVRKKMRNGKKYTVDNLEDIIGFRLVCLTPSEIPIMFRRFLRTMRKLDAIEGIKLDVENRQVTYYRPEMRRLDHTDDLRIAWQEFDGKDHKFSVPDRKESGYSSLHIVFHCRSSESKRLSTIPVEVQIRSAFEDVWSEMEHEGKYKLGLENQTQAWTDDKTRLFEYLMKQLLRLKSSVEFADDSANSVLAEVKSMSGSTQLSMSQLQASLPKPLSEILEEHDLREAAEKYSKAIFLRETALPSSSMPTTSLEKKLSNLEESKLLFDAVYEAVRHQGDST